MRWLRGAAAAYAVALLVLSDIHLIFPQRDGLLAISQVFAPHLQLPLLVVVPLDVNTALRHE